MRYKNILLIILFLTPIVSKSDGFGPDEPNKPLVIEGPMISVHVSDDTILQICRDIRHPESNQPIYDWLYPNFINLGKVTLSIRQALSSARYLENSHWYYQRIRATVWQKQTNILK